MRFTLHQLDVHGTGGTRVGSLLARWLLVVVLAATVDPAPSAGQTPGGSPADGRESSIQVTSAPGRIQAEDFDDYHDNDPENLGGQYRLDEGVDITDDFPDVDGTYQVGYIEDGEWLEYAVQVNQAASYVLSLRMAKYGAGGLFHVELDGAPVTASSLDAPDTGAFEHWVTLPVAFLSLTRGQHRIRLVFDAIGDGGTVMNLNWLELAPRRLAVPGRIQAEDFDPGEGVGYHDSTAANFIGEYRPDEGVDTATFYPDDDYSFEVGFIVAGEWLAYSVRVAESAKYVLRLRLAQYGEGGQFHVEIDGADVTGAVGVPHTGTYANWITMPLATVQLTKGPHRVRLVFDVNGANGGVMNLNWFELVRENETARENRRTGTSAWRDEITESDSPLKGYASAISVDRGEPITFYVTAPAKRRVNIHIYRMGYYGGLQGRAMATVANLLPGPKPACTAGSSTTPAECNWSPTYTLTVPSTWPSGVYLAKLQAGVLGNYIPFVVRDDARVADFLYVQPVTTYQAYNNYPSQNCLSNGSGKSLYDDFSEGGMQAFYVSFRRPHCGNGAGGGAGGGRGPDNGPADVFTAELPLIAWLERQGFDVAYATSIDLHRAHPDDLVRYRSIISPGHDEYWTKQMRDNVEQARDRGVDVAFFGSNAAYWQIRLEDNERTIVGYKLYAERDRDPEFGTALQTSLWREPPIYRPEQWLVGIQYPPGAPFSTAKGCCAGVEDYFPLQVVNTSSWVYAALPPCISPPSPGFSALSFGVPTCDELFFIPGIVGHEIDVFNPGTVEDATVPTNLGLNPGYPKFRFDGRDEQINPARYLKIADSGFRTLDEPDLRVYRQHSSVYQAPSGAWVFASGTLGWSLGLFREGRISRESLVVQKATENILYRFLSD